VLRSCALCRSISSRSEDRGSARRIYVRPALLVAPVTEQERRAAASICPRARTGKLLDQRARARRAEHHCFRTDRYHTAVCARRLDSSAWREGGQRRAATAYRTYSHLPGADATFTLFADDGRTYDYEKGGGRITHLRWDDAAQKLTHTGAEAWSGQDSSVIEIAGH